MTRESIMDLGLTGKRALVLASTRGLGLGIGTKLAEEGAHVLLSGRSRDKLERAVATIREAGGKADFVEADLTDPGVVDTLAAAVAEKLGGIDILVNNTGGPPGGPVAGATVDAFVQAFTRHLLANQVLAQAVLPGMQAAGWGRIVNVVSTSVREPIPGLGVSNTTRGAVAAWAKTLSREVAPQGITVNNVLPGFTETGRIAQIVGDRARTTGKSEQQVAEGMKATVPAARFARPEEIAAAIAFLCSPAAGYISGVSLAVDGGRMQSI